MATSKRNAYTLTAEDRGRFEASLRKWQKVLNLVDWRIELSDRPAGRGNSADVEVHYEHRLAKVRLMRTSSARPEDEHLDSVALHELLHVRLADLIHAVQEGADEKVIEAAEHSIIVLVEKLLRK